MDHEINLITTPKNKHFRLGKLENNELNVRGRSDEEWYINQHYHDHIESTMSQEAIDEKRLLERSRNTFFCD